MSDKFDELQAQLNDARRYLLSADVTNLNITRSRLGAREGEDLLDAAIRVRNERDELTRQLAELANQLAASRAERTEHFDLFRAQNAEQRLENATKLYDLKEREWRESLHKAVADRDAAMRQGEKDRIAAGDEIKRLQDLGENYQIRARNAELALAEEREGRRVQLTQLSDALSAANRATDVAREESRQSEVKRMERERDQWESIARGAQKERDAAWLERDQAREDLQTSQHWREHHSALLDRVGKLLKQPSNGPTLEDWAKHVRSENRRLRRRVNALLAKQNAELWQLAAEAANTPWGKVQGFHGAPGFVRWSEAWCEAEEYPDLARRLDEHIDRKRVKRASK